MKRHWTFDASLPVRTDNIVQEAMQMFAAADFAQDMAEDAKLVEVAHYLRGCRGLQIPPAWRPLLPTKL